MFLAWTVVKARQISRTLKQVLTILTKVLPYDITLSVLALFASN